MCRAYNSSLSYVHLCFSISIFAILLNLPLQYSHMLEPSRADVRAVSNLPSFFLKRTPRNVNRRRLYIGIVDDLKSSIVLFFLYACIHSSGQCKRSANLMILIARYKTKRKQSKLYMPRKKNIKTSTSMLINVTIFESSILFQYMFSDVAQVLQRNKRSLQ